MLGRIICIITEILVLRPYINNLTIDQYYKPSKNIYGQINFGYLGNDVCWNKIRGNLERQ